MSTAETNRKRDSWGIRPMRVSLIDMFFDRIMRRPRVRDCDEDGRSESDSERRRFWVSCITSMAIHVSVACALILIVFPRDEPRSPLEIVSRPIAEEEFIQLEHVEMLADVDIETEQAGAQAAGEAMETADAPVITVSAVMEDVRQSAADILDVVDVDLTKTLNVAIPNGVFGGRGGSGDGIDGFGVAFYGLKAFGKRFVFVADCSGSMAGYRLDALKKELRDTIEKLPASAQFSVVFFNHLPVIMRGSKLERATDNAKQAYLAWMDSIGPSGGTDPSEAVQHALRLKPTSVFLLTDGTFDPGPTIQAIKSHDRIGSVRFYAIAVGTGASADVLKQIAEMTGGDFRQVGE
jgi:uncharacterized protein YegL